MQRPDYDQILQQHKIALDNFASLLNQFRLEHEALKEKCDIPQEFYLFKSLVSSQIKEASTHLDSVFKNCSDLQRQFLDLNAQRSLDRSYLEDQKTKVDLLQCSIVDSDNYHRLKFKKLGDAIDQSSKSIRENVEVSIDLLKKEIARGPSSILETNKSILKNLEIAELEARNATSKLQNYDTHFKLLERKLESLDIRVKKLELGEVK